MDNANLEDVLASASTRQFWLKPFGIPEKEVDTREMFGPGTLRIDFATPPTVIEREHIVIGYRIGITLIAYVAQCTTVPFDLSANEIAKEPWRERWPWSIRARNLTPTFGTQWAQYTLNPFELVKPYNQAHTDDRQKLGAVQRGSDKLKISSGFAEMILRKIIEL